MKWGKALVKEARGEEDAHGTDCRAEHGQRHSHEREVMPHDDAEDPRQKNLVNQCCQRDQEDADVHLTSCRLSVGRAKLRITLHRHDAA